MLHLTTTSFPVRDTGKEVEPQVRVRQQGNTLGTGQFGREDQANTRVRRARANTHFDIQCRKVRTQVCVKIKGYRHLPLVTVNETGVYVETTGFRSVAKTGGVREFEGSSN